MNTQRNQSCECLERRADPRDYQVQLSALSARVLGEMRNALILAEHKALNRRFDGAPLTGFGALA